MCSLGSSRVSLGQCALFKGDVKAVQSAVGPQIQKMKAVVADRQVTLHCSRLLWSYRYETQYLHLGNAAC